MRIAKRTNVIVFLAKITGMYIFARARLLDAILGGAILFMTIGQRAPGPVFDRKIGNVLNNQKIRNFFGEIAS